MRSRANLVEEEALNESDAGRSPRNGAGEDQSNSPQAPASFALSSGHLKKKENDCYD